MRSQRIHEVLSVVFALSSLVPVTASGQGYDIGDPYGRIGGAEGQPRYPYRSYATMTPVERAAVYYAQHPAPPTVHPSGALPEGSGRVRPPGSIAPLTPLPAPSTRTSVPVRLASIKTVQERAGEVSQGVEVASESMRQQSATLLKAVRDAVEAMEKAPQSSVASEADRLKAMMQFLENSLALGKVVVKDEASFRKSFERWQQLSLKAVPVFHEAEAVFLKKAREAEFPEERELFERTAKWYAARAARAEVRAARTLPSEMDTEIRRIQKMVQAIEFLHNYMVPDPYFFKDDKAFEQNITAFLAAFQSVNQVLREWSTKLLEDMEEVKASEKGTPPEPAKRAA